MLYGSVAREFRERFGLGAFVPLPEVPLNLQHDRQMQILDAVAFELRDMSEALEIRAVLPETLAAIKLVRRNALNGLSVEFNAIRERSEGGIRVIERARLNGLALVDFPAYPCRAVASYVRESVWRGGRTPSAARK